MDERGDPAGSHMPSGFLLKHIQGDGGRARSLGQMGASIGFSAYSYQHYNWCFLFSNQDCVAN
jgi:hypothetical protein